MPDWECENCGNHFTRHRSGARPIRFCSQSCYREWRASAGITAGQFRPEQEPWNKGKKGIRLSPATEFKRGQPAKNKAPVGTVTIRHRKREPHPRAFVKIAEPNVWRERAKVVWEAAKGKIPRGHVIHHIDRNPLNDEIDNLACLTRAEHIAEHREESADARSAGLKMAWRRRRLAEKHDTSLSPEPAPKAEQQVMAL